MKKFLIVLLTMALALSMFACKNNEEPIGQGDKDVENLTSVYEGEDGTCIYMREDGSFIDQNGDPVTLEEDGTFLDKDGNVILEEEEDEDFGEETDFDLDIAKTYKFDKVLVKYDYSNLKGLEDTILAELAGVIDSVFKTTFELDTSYVEGNGDEVVGAYGYENGDVDQKNIEVGVYKTGETGEYSEYISYASECLYDVEDSTISNEITLLKNAFGITVNREKFKKAVSEIMAADTDSVSDTYRYQIEMKDYDLYTENVSFCITGATAEANPCWYVGVDIERVYK